tara:strand:+ start:530 stop:1978 length:1449 start_codon:yes stop_codon:yes gene_type:complete
MNLTKTTSFAHQLEVIEESKNREYFGLFLEMGTGKTHISIATAVHLWREGKINGLIVLAPNGVHSNWPEREFPVHLPNDAMSWEQVTWNSGMGKQRKDRWSYLAERSDENMICLFANIESVRGKEAYESMLKFVKRRNVLIIVDESTVIKNPKAKQTKQCLALASLSRYRRILTGTPITQSPLDLWSQCRFLSREALPYPSYTAFKAQFAIEELVTMLSRGITFRKIVGYRNQDLLADQILPFSRRLLKKDCLDLPSKLYEVREVDLTPEQKRLYKELSTTQVAMLDPGIATITEVITLMLRLHQIILGYLPDDEGNMTNIMHNRIGVLKDIIDETQGKVIVFVRFVEDVNQIRGLLEASNIQHVTYYGATSAKSREIAIDEFQNNPACKVFIGTSAAARGLTLTAANTVVYYSQGYSLETRLQSEDRAHRIGQKNNVTYIDLLSKGTVEAKIVSALKQKKNLAASIVDRESLEKLLLLDGL